MALRKEEITRKLLHLFALLMPVGIFYLPKFSLSPLIAAGVLAFLFAGSVVVEYLRFRIPMIQKIFYIFFGSMLRDEESGKTTGSTFVIGAALLCAILFTLFTNKFHVAFMVLFIFILGDAIAAIVGQSIGRIKIGKKSLEGSLACFLMCLLLFFGVFPFFPGLLDSWHGKVSVPIAVMVALSTTIFELVPLKITRNFVINDNLAVPVISGFLMIGMEKLLGF